MNRRIQSVRERGFTIIELLIVIIIIGILATITLIVYSNVTNAARDKSVLSDLDALDGIETDYGLKNNTVGKAWYSGNGIDSDLNFTPSQGDIIDVVVNSTDYCIRGYNPGGTKKTIYNAFTKESSPGACNTLPPSSAATGASPSCNSIPNQICVSTFVGSSYGLADGTGTSAQFEAPAAIVQDSSGNFYVLDNNANNIREVTPTGVVTTFVGATDGSAGYVDGTGTNARFASPWGLGIDSSGNLYVADSGNNNIRKVTPAGVVTTFAGATDNSSGLVDASGTNARFNYPDAIAVGSTGIVYVADSSNDCIREITPSGNVTTLAGSGSPGFTDGTGSGAQFNDISGVAVDSSGTVYVADSGNNSIRKITSAGVVTTLAGSATSGSADGTGSSAQFNYPAGVTVGPSGVLYIADSNQLIRQVTQAGVVTTFAGSGTFGSADGINTSAQFENPNATLVDSSGTVYVADTWGSKIRMIR